MNVVWRSIMDAMRYEPIELPNVDGRPPLAATFLPLNGQPTCAVPVSIPGIDTNFFPILPVDLIHLTGPDSIGIGEICPRCNSWATATTYYSGFQFLILKTDVNSAPFVDVVPILQKQYIFQGKQFVIRKMFELNDNVVSEVALPERLPNGPWRLRIVIVLIERV
ncbi:hypothetical protein CAEBREN_11229 [Caenorhabditis brenneri]|uniref:Uncharacterized protein n=1 Tax=Caenorhabditis brenneri TaxID=135651 RepID=G0MW65_CAEBE|nr:hypothetical protein CAEBREN_11229 [Caenorhabditis brenneri]